MININVHLGLDQGLYNLFFTLSDRVLNNISYYFFGIQSARDNHLKNRAYTAQLTLTKSTSDLLAGTFAKTPYIPFSTPPNLTETDNINHVLSIYGGGMHEDFEILEYHSSPFESSDEMGVNESKNFIKIKNNQNLTEKEVSIVGSKISEIDFSKRIDGSNHLSFLFTNYTKSDFKKE